MKKFKIRLKLYHESFSGYDHFDGYTDIVVSAKNDGDAKEKARNKAEKSHGGWAEVYMINP